MRKVCFTLLILLCGCFAFADSLGKIRGKIVDKEGNPLEGVVITIDSLGSVKQSYTAHTNAKGEYIHIGVVPGKYRVSVAKEGYQATDFVELQITPSDRPESADFTMVAIVKAQEQKAAESGNADAEAAMAFMKEGKTDEAIASFNKALAKDANSPALHYNLAVALERKDQPEEARKQYQEAIRLKPDFGEAYFALGNSYLAERKFDGPTVEALVKATELMPANYGSFYNLGVCYSNAGKYSEAEGAFRKATELDAKEPVAHYQLGMALLGQSKNKEARAEFQKYLELNPSAADRSEVEDLIKTLE